MPCSQDKVTCLYMAGFFQHVETCTNYSQAPPSNNKQACFYVMLVAAFIMINSSL